MLKISLSMPIWKQHPRLPLLSLAQTRTCQASNRQRTAFMYHRWCLITFKENVIGRGNTDNKGRGYYSLICTSRAMRPQHALFKCGFVHFRWLGGNLLHRWASVACIRTTPLFFALISTRAERIDIRYLRLQITLMVMPVRSIILLEKCISSIHIRILGREQHLHEDCATPNTSFYIEDDCSL
jgi:hypothetical protein